MNTIMYNYNIDSDTSTTAFQTVNNNNNNNNNTLIMTDTMKAGEDNNITRNHEGMLSATVTSYPRSSSSPLSDNAPRQEAAASDTASSNVDMEDILYKIRMNNSSLNVPNEQSGNYYYDNSSQSETLASSQIWSDKASTENKNNETVDTFDFLIKSISSANNYVSMLTREQLCVLRSIRPSLLYEFLQEIVRVRNERRMRRALPHECAFCKNNGENEDIYASHALKDVRGRVLCPVLRAFSCPKCGATGERAHTIKYCPENIEIGSDRLGSRRRFPSLSTLLVGANAGTGYEPMIPTTPASSPLPTLSATWNSFHLN